MPMIDVERLLAGHDQESALLLRRSRSNDLHDLELRTRTTGQHHDRSLLVELSPPHLATFHSTNYANFIRTIWPRSVRMKLSRRSVLCCDDTARSARRLRCVRGHVGYGIL